VRVRSRTSDGFASAWTEPLVITVSPGEVFETDDMEPNLEAEDPEVVAEREREAAAEARRQQLRIEELEAVAVRYE
jgi:hypothetical protein